MAKVALLIGVSEYEPGLTPLPAAIKDVEAMQRVLLHPDIGSFDDVKLLVNPQRQAMEEAIENLFAGRPKDDLVLLFFSGHGIKDEGGKLYFATRNTRKNEKGGLVQATAVSANFVQEIMRTKGRSKRQVVILDCCFSGAFAEDMLVKDDGSVDVMNQLGGEGRAVLTSSTSTQYSFEQKESNLSIYTRYLVEGIETGAADTNDNGVITVDELHEYARKKVREAAPTMSPEIYPIREGYTIVLAKAPLGDPKLKYRKEVERFSHGGEISSIGRKALEQLQVKLKLSSEIAIAIENEALQPYRDYQKRLQEYEQVLEEAQKNLTLNSDAQDDLQRFQQILGLRDEDIALIEASQKIKFNLAPQSIGVLTMGILIGGVTVWFIKPDKEFPLVTPPEPIVLTREFAKVPNVPEGTFKYGGSTSWAFIYPKLESEIKKVHPKFDIKIRKDLVLGSGIGIQKLIDGGKDGLDFALSSRDVNPEEKRLAKEKGFTLKAIPVTKSGLAIAVNPRLAINSLDKEQLSKIFSGKVDNWKRVGAFADIPIKFYVRSNNYTSTGEFKKTLGIQEFGKNINYVNTVSEGLQKIAREPGGIFEGAISDVVPQCGIKTLPIVNKEGKTFYPYQKQNSVSPAECRPGKRNRVNIKAIYSDEYPLPVIFYVVVKQNGQREEQAGQAYADLLSTQQGQEIIKNLQETGSLD
ncbi:substrate-binding domain-containing protein [Nostoc calcicola FACHB-3891]|nr:substrate-binding domain-containing protein [Nostoc calcicola FACHB-3891]